MRNQDEDFTMVLLVMDRALRRSPDMSLREFRDQFAAGIEAAIADRETAVCRRCGKGIFLVGDTWYHDDPDQCRGCRAASWREGEGRDESLNPRWTATPA